MGGRKIAIIFTRNFWTSFDHIFSIRCLPGVARTFAQASRRFLAYVFLGILTFRRKHLLDKFRKIPKNLEIINCLRFATPAEAFGGRHLEVWRLRCVEAQKLGGSARLILAACWIL